MIPQAHEVGISRHEDQDAFVVLVSCYLRKHSSIEVIEIERQRRQQGLLASNRRKV